MSRIGRILIVSSAALAWALWALATFADSIFALPAAILTALPVAMWLALEARR